ncbi:MAG: molybdopterin molybdotransferase MoeA, partial [Bacteroidia bacterium]|nr:molybdopterin molybdotransferase MoeA [Bacteroidia bacterium]
MISSSKALKIILDNALKLGTEKIPLNECIGRCLAQSLKTDRDFPPFNRVAMDGYAIKYSALKKYNSNFAVQSTQYAGDKAHALKSDANAIEIMTGAVLPKGTDTVIQYEHTSSKGKIMHIEKAVRKGQNVHKQGSDKKKGQVLLAKNRIITPAEIATLATLGISKVEVVKLPKAVVISTGNELVNVDKKPRAHQIRMSNSYMLQSFLKQHRIDADIVHIK